MRKLFILFGALGLFAGCNAASAAHPAQSSTFRTGALPAYNCCDGFYMPEVKPKRDKPKPQPQPPYDGNRPGKPHEPHKEHGPESAA
jgi:hypothetical protein